MKKLFLLLVAAATMTFASCGGGGGSTSSFQVPVSLDELDDYFTVKSYKLETDVKEKGLEHLEDAHGTLTMVLKRNNEEMKLKPSDIKYAEVGGSSNGTDYYVFKADIDGVARKLVKLEPGKEETIEIPIMIVDPYNRFDSDEENLRSRQIHYDALTGVKGALAGIYFNVKLRKGLEKSSYFDDDYEEDDDY